MTLVKEAEAKAEARLISAHEEEFNELMRVELLKAGLGELVVVRKVTEKTVTEVEALTLERFGWERVA